MASSDHVYVDMSLADLDINKKDTDTNDTDTNDTGINVNDAIYGSIGDTIPSFKVIIKKIKEIDWSVNKPVRAGVIIYTVIDGILYFIMGRDATYGDITDFGGGVQYRNGDNTAVDGALREFMEESLDVFGQFTMEQINDMIVAISTNEMMILFLHLTLPDFASQKQQFEKKKNEHIERNESVEINELVVLTIDDFKQFIAGDSGDYDFKMYVVVREFLEDAMKHDLISKL